MGSAFETFVDSLPMVKNNAKVGIISRLTSILTIKQLLPSFIVINAKYAPKV